MKRRLVWFGLAAFLLGLVCVLPVRWLTGIVPAQLQCTAWSGSVWRGQCAGLAVQQPGQAPIQVDLLRWKLHASALLRLALRAELDVNTAQGSGAGLAEFARGGRILVQGLSATAVFDRRLATMLPPGWSGQLAASNLNLRLAGNRIESLSGELTLRDFNDGRGGTFGSYTLQFPAAGPPFVGRLRDAGGPLSIAATVTISTERRWQINGTVTPRAEASASLRSRMDLLGAADSEGRYPLSLEGSFK
jgi:hypothetical protein